MSVSKLFSVRKFDSKVLAGICLYFLAVFSLFFYSFTQVDLNLTLSRVTLLYGFQDFFQFIGYFNRPFSLNWYLYTLLMLGITYLILLLLSWKNKISSIYSFILILSTSVILLFSYPAFSYDLYNYMFDARIITKYGQSPYEHKALDYPTDPWITFMRWTHRTYPYGPVWLAATVPLSVLGFGKLLPTILLFKMIAVVSYAASCLLIYKLLLRLHNPHPVFGTLYFALNPLVIIETLVSAHNDIFMIMLALASLYLLVTKKYVLSFIMLVVSVGVKFATVFLLPQVCMCLVNPKQVSRYIYWGIIGMAVAVIAASVRTQFQPWYLLYIIPFVSLVPSGFALKTAVGILSFGMLLLYAPFIYLGNWNPPVPTILNLLIIATCLLSAAVYVTVFFLRRHKYGTIG